MPTPRPLAPVARLRLSRRLAAGVGVARAAAAEGMAAAEVEDLLADPEFAGLVEACRELDAMPEEQAAERLVGLARFCVEDAVHRGDVRVAFFVLREHQRGRYAPRTVARGVVAARRRELRAADRPVAESAPVATPTAAPAPWPRRPAPHPADRLAWRVAAGMRASVTRELALRQGTPEPVANSVDRPSPIVGLVPALSPCEGEETRGETRATAFAPSPSVGGGRAGVRALAPAPSPVRRMGEGGGEGGRTPPPPPGHPRPPLRPDRLAALLASGTAVERFLTPAGAGHPSRPPQARAPSAA
jgi:hypothetical protein